MKIIGRAYKRRKLTLKALRERDDYGRITIRTTVLQGGLASILYRMGVMPMRNHFDFKDMLTFGIFLLALLTFVFTFCR